MHPRQHAAYHHASGTRACAARQARQTMTCCTCISRTVWGDSPFCVGFYCGRTSLPRAWTNLRSGQCRSSRAGGNGTAPRVARHAPRAAQTGDVPAVTMLVAFLHPGRDVTGEQPSARTPRKLHCRGSVMTVFAAPAHLAEHGVPAILFGMAARAPPGAAPLCHTSCLRCMARIFCFIALSDGDIGTTPAFRRNYGTPSPQRDQNISGGEGHTWMAADSNDAPYLHKTRSSPLSDQRFTRFLHLPFFYDVCWRVKRARVGGGAPKPPAPLPTV